jgi:hypothetical protein
LKIYTAFDQLTVQVLLAVVDLLAAITIFSGIPFIRQNEMVNYYTAYTPARDTVCQKGEKLPWTVLMIYVLIRENITFLPWQKK